MSTSPIQPISSLGAYGRGVAGALVMGLSLGISVALGELWTMQAGVDGITGPMVQAVMCSVLVVPTIILLRRSVDGRPLRGLGLTDMRTGLATFGLGALITVASATLMLGLGTLVGWIRWHGIEWPTFMIFVLTAAFLIFFFEALPEELALRGYTYRNLNLRLSRWAAAVGAAFLFLLIGSIANVSQAIVMGFAGSPISTFSLLPAGEDVNYVIFLATFSLVLVVARVTTNSLWTAIGLHLTFILINRGILSEDASQSGLSVELTSPLAMLLISGYLIVTGVALHMFAEFRNHHVDWGAVESEEI